MNAASRSPLSRQQMAVLMAMLVALMPFSVDAYLPAIPEMAQGLKADIHLIEQSLSTFMFGVAVGQVVGGSVSDIKGRRPVALVGLAVYLVSVLLLSMAQTGGQLLLLRMVQAFGAGMTVVVVGARRRVVVATNVAESSLTVPGVRVVVVGALVRDYYEGREAAQMFALIGIIMMAVPLVAPMLGAELQKLGGWRAIFVFLLAYAVLLLGLMAGFLPKPAKTEKIGRDIFAVVAGRFKRVLQTRAAMGYLFFQAFSFSSMFVFLTESSFVYMKLYGVSPRLYAWMFGLNIITMATFNRITAWRLKTGTHPQAILKWGIIVQLGANLLMAVSAAAFDLPPFWLLVGCVMFSVGTQGLVSANTQACFMGYFKEEGGSANAVLGVCQSVIGASVGMLTTWLHNGTAQIMPFMMLASTVFGIILLRSCSHQAWKENSKAAGG